MTKVTLRQKAISKGRQTLYLDYYPPIPNPDTGNPTRREFLKIYIHERPKSDLEKVHNTDTKALAEKLRAERQLAVQNRQYGFISDRQRETNFVTYFKTLAEKRKGSNNDNWISALKYLERFTGGILKLSELNEAKCEQFKEYLLTASTSRSEERTLAQNSAVSYFNKFKAALKQAYKDGLLSVDINGRVDGIKANETEREYLTAEELTRLAKAECRLPQLKQAGLFSALTGLRFSDVEKLKWNEVQFRKDDGYFIQHRQKKTGNVETLPISNEAFELLGERGKADDRIFDSLKYSAHTNDILREWVRRAGIEKEFTFHGFRHTYAVLQLVGGTDIYTLQKMLGHKDIKQTMVYAKVMNPAKRQAANRVSLNLAPMLNP